MTIAMRHMPNSIDPVAPSRASLTALQVGASWFPERAGGLDRYYYDLIHALPAAGVTCHGLVIGTPNVDVDSRLIVHAYAASDTSMVGRWRAVRAAVRELKHCSRIDVCVSHFAPYAFPFVDMLDVPSIVHFHGPWAAESQREGAGRIATIAKRAIEHRVYRRADRLIVLSVAFRDLLCNDYGVDSSRVRVIPGGVNTDRFAPAYAMTRVAARERLGWPTDRPIVLAVRRLASRMGLEGLIDAIAALRGSTPDVLCLIAGRGRLERMLRAQIAKAGLGDHVRLLGFVADDALPFAYRAADLSVMPTESLEGFGLSAAESLASGTPVLVTPVGGLPEVVRGLDPTLILADATTDALTAGLRRCLKDQSTLPKAADCHAYVMQTFDWRNIAQRVADVYRELDSV